MDKFTIISGVAFLKTIKFLLFTVLKWLVYLALQPAFSDWVAAGAEVWAGLQAMRPATTSHWTLVMVCKPVQAFPLF